MIALDELKIPRGLRPVADEIVGITDSVCLSVLDEEYADLARRAVAKLARKRPSPQAGRRATWAAGWCMRWAMSTSCPTPRASHA